MHLARLGVRARYAWIASVSLACILWLGCDDSDDDDGGTGGMLGGSGGTADTDAGGMDGGHVTRWVEPGFRVYLLGISIVLEMRTTTTARFWYLTCQNAIRVEKHEDGAWIAMRDDRHPSASNPGYYLDGKYVPASSNLGCDAVGCEQFGKTQEVGRAEEYVKTGTKAPPAGQPADTGEVDVVETRPFHGDVRVHLDYSRNAHCDPTDEVSLPLTIPEEGVCCPTASVNCEGGPLGGWAPSLAQCSQSIITDSAFRESTDAHGCPILIEDDSVCCLVCPDDAGP
jgi:hypothetical protein